MKFYFSTHAYFKLQNVYQFSMLNDLVGKN